MYSTTEEKKTYVEQIDTASTEFYKAPAWNLFKSQINQTSSIEQLEDDIAAVRQTITTNRQLLRRLESNQQLRKYVQQTQQQLEVVRARALNQQNNLRLSFEKSISSLERELASYKKNWKQIKENAENEVEEQIASFKGSIKKDQQNLNKMLCLASSDIKSKTASVLSELKQTKKLRGQSTSFLMGIIEQARSKFETFTEDERRKRNEYDSVVLGLLDRTVDQGERMLRRIG